ncbi:MAG: hypothetical protein EHM93_19295 [Bacteroidales bacterium]|nr:MAG: hypothetical protein EHM93_19295 [Bacteroidales bacterium]
MEENAWVPIIAILSTFGTTFGLIFYYLHTRNRQRLAMLEKGVDPKTFYPRPTTNRYSSLKWGLLMVGIGLGILFGGFLSNYMEDEGPAIFSMIMLFGGLGLLVYFLIAKKNDPDGDK